MAHSTHPETQTEVGRDENMLLSFNDLLNGENIDNADVLVLRHTPRKEERKLRENLAWLAAVHPHLFNAYQQTQSEKVEKKMLHAKYVASFIGLEQQKAVFVGLYKVGNHRQLTRSQFWQKLEYKQLKKYELRGFQRGDKRRFVLWFDLKMTEFYRKWQGKLITEWTGGPRNWSRFANKGRFPISAILEDTTLHKTLPAWNELVISRTMFNDLPPKWCDQLRRSRGIYYIFYPSDRKGYVGSAAGKDNIYGRWKYHVKVGGDSVHMRMRKSQDFQFSILQTLHGDTDKQEVIEHERRWKIRLHTKIEEGGLNKN